MTLPKSFPLSSDNFNHCDTMSVDVSSMLTSAPITNPSNQHEQAARRMPQQQMHQSQLSAPSSPVLNVPTSSPMLFNAVANPAIPLASASALSLEGSIVPASREPLVENIMPCIYLTKNFIPWNNEELRAHGFTHVIIIDKHIQELYYPHQQPEIFKRNKDGSSDNNNTICKGDVVGVSESSRGLHDHNTSLLSAFDYDYTPATTPSGALRFAKDFEVIDLNFGEKSYLTTVLPNCYRAVKFMNEALQSSDAKILVIDCNGGEQKCITVIVAYLMYKHNISFSNAFARLKQFYKNADLDRFYTSQLYEYEPILQVQRAQSRGHSCSRELHAAILKRKKPLDESLMPPASSDLFLSCNPLNRFDAAQMNEMVGHSGQSQRGCKGVRTFMCGPTSTTRDATATITPGGWYNWDDYAME